MKVGIVGLGLIGGSLARDLSAAGHEVLGYDRSASTLRKARRAGAISKVLGADLAGLENVDVGVIALPVDATRRALFRHAPRLASLAAVTDVGSTKVSILRAAERAGLGACFVGSHPMAGGHESGWQASVAGLFAAKPVYITPTRTSSPRALSLVRRLWRTVGGRMETIAAPAHDQLLAATSHLPQVVALALARVYADARLQRDILGRGGREMTRLAGSNPDMWAAILTDNRKNVAARIARLRRSLSQIEEMVTRGDAAALRRLLILTNAWARK